MRIMLFTGIAVALETCMFAAVSLYASKRGIQKGITSLLVPLAQLTRHHVCYSLFMWTFAAHGNRTCTQLETQPHILPLLPFPVSTDAFAARFKP